MSERPTVKEVIGGRDWWEVRMAVEQARENRKRLNRRWCIVCGRAAVEEHPARFHAAGGALAGPFCSETCAFLWLKDDRITDGEYPREHVRESYRHDKELDHFEDVTRAERQCNVRLFPSIQGHDWGVTDA